MRVTTGLKLLLGAAGMIGGWISLVAVSAVPTANPVADAIPAVAVKPTVATVNELAVVDPATSAKDEQSTELRHAVELAKTRFGGEVVKADYIAANGRDRAHYEVRLLNNGRVRDVMIDAQSWGIMGGAGEN